MNHGTTHSDEWAIDWRCKNFPPSADGMSATAIKGAGLSAVDDFSTPIAVLYETALVHNLTAMSRFCAERGLGHAPHGKTTMSPELIARQLAHGAWGMTAATAWQARVMITMGARRVIIANECLDRPGLAWIVKQMRDDPGLEVYAFVDSPVAVRQLSAAVAAVEDVRPLLALVELGVTGGRAGARTVPAAVAVGDAVVTAPGLELAGVAGFEGVIGATRDPATITAVRSFLTDMGAVAHELATRRAFRTGSPVVLSAGGSMFFDLVADELTSAASALRDAAQVMIRPGCYLTHDHGIYHANTPLDGDGGLRPAMFVWARVLSTPEPHLAIIDAGKRDISTDAGPPQVIMRRRNGHDAPLEPAHLTVDRLNDQHGFVRVTVPGLLRVGDLVALGVSHPCTTFDRWRAIPVVDDNHRVTDVIRTFF